VLMKPVNLLWTKLLAFLQYIFSYFFTEMKFLKLGKYMAHLK
jgi:hypothetical protein